ncbi:MAG: hypothetical protein ACTSYA_01230 [Candidatus Kariarchaeaceae archaeon]
MSRLISMKEALREFREVAEQWEKQSTSIPGLRLVRMPQGKKQPFAKLSVEMMPVDEEGNPRKRKGLFITNLEDFEFYAELFANPKVRDLLETIIDLNLETEPKKEDESVLEL